MIVELVA